MIFIVLLALTTFSIAASAAFFSVVGLMQVFSGVATPILVMGASLEAGKLLSASYLYRHWKELGIFVRSLYISAIAILMLLTSIGIFGYLTAAYQKDSQPIKEIEQSLVQNKDELKLLEDRKKDIDKQISELPNNYVNGRNRLIATFKPELDKINPQIAALKTEISEAETKKLETETHIGPIIFVAKAFGRTPDDAVFYFTLLIISVFDPLAVALTIATNNAIRTREEKLKPKVIVSENKPEPTPEPSLEPIPTPTAEPTPTPSAELVHTTPKPTPEAVIVTPSPEAPTPSASPILIVEPDPTPEPLKSSNSDDLTEKRRVLIASTRKDL